MNTLKARKNVLLVAVLGGLLGTAAVHADDSMKARSADMANAMYGTSAEVRQAAIDWAALQVYLNQGMWKEAIAVGQDADHSALVKSLGHGLDGSSEEERLGMYYLAYAYLQSAQDDKAQQIYQLMMAQSHDNGVDYHLASIPARSALERHDWEQAARIEVPPSANAVISDEAGLVFAKTIGAARAGQVDAAKVSMRHLLSLYQSVKKEGTRHQKRVVATQVLAAQAWVQQAQGHQPAALSLMQKAVEKERQTLKLADNRFLAAWQEVIPMNELLGDMLLEQGALADAKAAYVRSLQQSHNRYNSLYGAAYAAEHLGESETAESYYIQLLSMTNANTTERDSLEHARNYMARSGNTLGS
jgi:tetratricopeptide (TPR) repeat protein